MKPRPIALAMVLGLVLSFFTTSARADYNGKKFPGFDAKDAITGKRFTLADLKGKVVIIDFWATWCGPCVRELPNVRAVHEKYKDRGLEIVSISLDEQRDRFESFVKSNGMPWRHVMDGGGWNTRLAKKYGVNSIPRMMVIDHEGTCVADKVRGERLDSAVEQAIRKAEDAAQVAPPREEPAKVEEDVEPGADDAAIGPAPLDPELVRNLVGQMESARRELAPAATALSRLHDRLKAARELYASVRADLPSPARPVQTRESYCDLRARLLELRCELFAIGCLNDGCVRLPADVLAGESGSASSRSFFLAHQQMSAAGTALERFDRAIGSDAGAVSMLQKGIRDLTEQAEAGSGEAAILQARCDELSRSVAELAERWREPWRRQLAELPSVVGRLNASPSDSSSVAELKEKVASLQQRAASLNIDEATFTGMRDEFTRVCAALNQAVQQRPRSARPIRLPTNPLERRSVRDRSALAQFEVQLRVAGEAIAQLQHENESTALGSSAAIDPLMAQAKLLQEELAATDDASAIRDVQSRFVALCGDLLAALN